MQNSALLMPKREGQGPGARRIKAMAGWRGLPVSCSPALAARCVGLSYGAIAVVGPLTSFAQWWWCRRGCLAARHVPCAAPDAALRVPCVVPDAVPLARFAVPVGAPCQTSPHP